MPGKSSSTAHAVHELEFETGARPGKSTWDQKTGSQARTDLPAGRGDVMILPPCNAWAANSNHATDVGLRSMDALVFPSRTRCISAPRTEGTPGVSGR